MALSDDLLWKALRDQAADWVAREPALASFVYTTILSHASFEDALSFHLAKKIGGRFLNHMQGRDIILESFKGDPDILVAARADLDAIYQRNPACRTHLEAFLFYKGFHALEVYRTAHWFWRSGRPSMALLLQSRISRRFSVDIHPGAKLGKGIMIDHGGGVVIGETAVIDDDVSLLHGVTLGGSGTEDGARHPKIHQGVLLSVGATVLGAIDIGAEARIGAGSLVLSDVPADCSAVGVPAHLVNCGQGGRPAHDMDHVIDDPGL
jgi:serine O-acetyltransferase